MPPMRLLSAALLTLVAALAVPALAQPRADSAYADHGFALVKLPPSAAAAGVAFTPDGGTVHVGTFVDAAGAFVARLDAGGTPAASFGANGVALLAAAPDGAALRLTSVAVLPDGRVVAGGSLRRPDTPDAAVLVALRPDGTLDPAFGTAGVAALPVLPSTKGSRVTALAAVDGGVVAVGTDGAGQEVRAFATRVGLGGQLDPSFASGGLRVALGSAYLGLAVRPDGRLVIAGSLNRPAYTDWLVTALTAAGQPDASFAGNGVLLGNVFGESADVLTGVLALADGSLLLSGTTAKSHDGGPAALGTTLVRVTAGGQPDASFGYQGAVWTDVVPSAGGAAGTGAERPGTPFTTDTGLFGVAVGGDRQGGLAVLTVLPTGDPDAVTRLFTDRAGLTFAAAVERDGLVVATGAQTDAAGRQEPFSARIVVKAPPVTATSGAPALGAALAVAPNPAAGAARVALTLDAPADARVRVTDALGRTVATLAERAFPAGTTVLALDAARLAPGVYAVAVQTAAGVAVQRLTVAR